MQSSERITAQATVGARGVKTVSTPPRQERRRGQSISSPGGWSDLSIHARRMLAVTAMSFGLQAHALQVVEASDGVAVEAVVSLKEPTRVRIDGAAITDVFGNIHSSHCSAATLPATPATPGMVNPTATASPPINPSGDVVVECDRDKGEIYLRPAGDSSKPINLFVSSANATYTLLLRRADIPADTIVIRDKTPRAIRPGMAGSGSSGPAPNHVRVMKGLLVAMASDRVPQDVKVEEISREVQLWSEAKFSLRRTYEGRGYVGEKYLLQNISASPMVLAEQEFDRPGNPSQGEVSGVAIERHNLLPGQSTNVYVIRRGGVR